LVMNLHVRMASPVWFEKRRLDYVRGPNDAALACEGAQTCVAASEGGGDGRRSGGGDGVGACGGGGVGGGG
jgi:hypothetical protein